MSMESTVVITMAGVGKRFRDAGYRVPKYMVEVHGRTLFAWSMESLRSFAQAGSPFVFVVRREDAAQQFIASQARLLGLRSAAVVELDAMTDGQATTALASQGVIDRASPLLIYNIDTYVDPQYLDATLVRGDGWIPCFPGTGDAWSFVRTERNSNHAIEVREKVRVSPHATVGLYWFSSAALYADAYARYYAVPRHIEKGERYVAPLYNQLIEDGLDVWIHRVPSNAVIGLGTPVEVERFAASRVR